jgi:hypothetical protein
MDSDMQATDAGTIELGRRLEAYARARLSPDPRATARTRARVMREARLSFEAARIAVHVAPAIAASGRSTRRRVAVPALAAALWLAVAVGAMAAAQAGGPLYPTRMWIENATLPAAAGARTVADLNRLDARLAEALAGAATDDKAAVAAALGAYSQIADDASAESASDPALQEMVAEALDQHRLVLTAIAARLADKGNVTASEAIERNIQRAIDHNAAVILGIGKPSTSQPGAGSGSSGGAGSGSGGAASGGNAGGAGGGAGGATSGGSGNAGAGTGGPPTPAHTPAPKPTPDPTSAGSKPVRTPRPTPDGQPQPNHSPRVGGN